MGSIKEINIKTQTYYFFNDMINIKYSFKLSKNRQKITRKYCYLLH